MDGRAPHVTPNITPPVPDLIKTLAHKEYIMTKLPECIALFASLAILSATVLNAQIVVGVAGSVEVTTQTAGAPTLTIQDLISSARQYADEKADGLSSEEKHRRLSVKDRINGILDLREMAHQILIRQWDNLKPTERERYSGLLAKLVERIGYPQIEKYFNGKLEVVYVGEKTFEGGNKDVLTKIVYKEEDLTLSSEFRMHPTDKGWRVYDVVTDGESLLLIYRNQHTGIIKDKGFPHLIKLMEKKLSETK